jgi:hypothetical protein
MRAMANFHRKYPMIDPQKVRNGPSGYYNCHGLTFASRRTNIEEPDDIWHILNDDGYIPIPFNEARPGDVLVYFKDGVINHTAIIVSEPDPFLKVPMVIAKFSSGPEAICAANACPEYNLVDAKVYRVAS